MTPDTNTASGAAEIAATICKSVAELPDRDSPADWPDAMLVTHDELSQIVIAALASAAAPAVAAIVFEHEDGRYAVNPDTTGDPAWHRLGPVDISALNASPQPAPPACTRSHPHEHMTWRCQIRTVIAEMRNLDARGQEATGHMLGTFADALDAALLDATAPPADSVTAPAGAGVAHALSDAQIEAMPVWRNFVGLWPESRREIVDAVVDLLTTPAAQAADSVLEDAARWQEHVGKLDALVAYCPTCCQGFIAQKEMTRDQIIFECGKTAGRADRKQGGA